MVPASIPIPVPEEHTLSEDRFSIYPGSVVSIYIPQAGFLWSDHKYWDEESGIFEPIVINDDSDSSPELAEEGGQNIITQPNRRVIFKDPVGRAS
jgi:hypothetical protein